MARVESEARMRRRRRNIQSAVLRTVGVAGILAVTMIAPNIFQALPRIMGDKYKFGYRAKTASGRLAKKGLLRFVERGGIRYATITEKGRRALALELTADAHKRKRPRRWDKRYRLVMFDVPQYRRSTRDRLRRLMREYGFLRLQNSVWVYPHDCEELISLIKADLRIGKDVLYAVVESIEYDAWIKKHFKLS
ncbi:CRISPR-associated endonuclease Cas2 [Candidatus Kaiserbacteria bacterium RIFCSPHIGHO2_02_FULL_55_25]|uniref:CRISPR-associated endonuclease Cas2 n=1 Tax=Candidatus Kaiserbacteria bacterium RIFCSPHIGHO2_02_FULL_55_25 TaxID=1798498 RepID=A0A1F6E4P3_9BACT|nr:MAG: CRISPR-associated endonuclease Cas2 [Candidatus Kaiserbacteria bacterium RIFCSPHIGHO2_01_FULL_55_79]OGG68653.1 MAG: CRISPR-associated endonuclease Cas2 [Candidatus Kaiserbacteria bacterium RIFCSPHIGHO2_02_FULL_55_25]OGG78677.1 MAG: CRISPR-associated endonuclease Cas2 [Candidatus Kaiserbacteria bacterium RIFCSPHIGHO2_12_FULL_55_13]OGG83024.1 MAG: CRISPR-associated endonuclease Cas2 [Candidatus Kaiserbacteria bacterium RIFCSPLOWO2_01_FULL_55_25]